MRLWFHVHETWRSSAFNQADGINERRGNMYQDQEEPNWNRRFEDERQPESGGIVRKAAWITASALLFGTVSGTVMVGMNIAASGILSNINAAMYAIESAPSEPQGAFSVPSEDDAPVPEILSPAPESGANVSVFPGSDVSDIVERAMPSVVAITSTALYQSSGFGYGWFFGGGSQTYEVPSSGSGIIVGENEKELLIVTNNHVVEDSTSLKVAFIDDEAVDAVVKGTDPDIDLAVIAVSLDEIPQTTKEKITAAVLGNSDLLKVGQGVIAIGNALGYGQSVTVGCVSALNREVNTRDQVVRTLLQTDAAINPGNSGGALLNMNGEVIGINVAKYSSTDVEGIGYAIPISRAMDIIDQLMNRKTRTSVPEEKRGYLGIQGTSVDEGTSKLFDMPKGVYVYKLLEGGAAAGSELKEKDIITKIDGQTIKNMAELQELLSCYEVGEMVELTVQTQQDGEYQEHTVSIVLASKTEGSISDAGEGSLSN